MYEYEFERIKLSTTGYGLFGGLQIGTQEHLEIIRTRAAAGWRFAGCFPVYQNKGGYIETIDLIFEREKN